MDEGVDLRDLLRDWEFDPQHNIRVLSDKDGREIMQVRLPLGVEQYEMDGRPDGKRPHNCESALDFYLARHGRMTAEGRGSEFILKASECAELMEEGTVYYYRYLHLFQIGDWKRTARDTTRNIVLFDLLKRYAERPEDRVAMEKWRPYLLRMDGVALTMIELGKKNYGRAMDIAQQATRNIRGLADVDDESFRFEKQRSLDALDALIVQIAKSRPLSEEERLESEMNKAVASEEFEKAAELRDKIRDLQTRAKASKPA